MLKIAELLVLCSKCGESFKLKYQFEHRCPIKEGTSLKDDKKNGNTIIF
jgi:hypothetical protein